MTTATVADEHEEKVSNETFFRIYGAGKRKALETPIKLRFDDQIVEFTPKDTAGLQKLIDFVVSQNSEMYAELSRLRAQIASNSTPKPRIRVKAGSYPSYKSPIEPLLNDKMRNLIGDAHHKLETQRASRRLRSNVKEAA